MGRPVIFRSRRAGTAPVRPPEVPDHAAPAYDDQPDAERLTRFGTWLRSTSLDELPELVNIVRGEMVLVGPRPLFDWYTRTTARSRPAG